MSYSHLLGKSSCVSALSFVFMTCCSFPTCSLFSVSALPFAASPTLSASSSPPYPSIAFLSAFLSTVLAFIFVQESVSLSTFLFKYRQRPNFQTVFLPALMKSSISFRLTSIWTYQFWWNPFWTFS